MPRRSGTKEAAVFVSLRVSRRLGRGPIADGAARTRRTSVLPQAKPWRRRNLLPPSILKSRALRNVDTRFWENAGGLFRHRNLGVRLIAGEFRRLRAASSFAHGGKGTKTPPGTRPMGYGFTLDVYKRQPLKAPWLDTPSSAGLRPGLCRKRTAWPGRCGPQIGRAHV